MKEDPNKITYFAETNSRGKALPFGIKRRDRARHMYVIGKTGMGKSTLLENMAIQDIRNGEAMAFIDPHGSTAERIMEYIPAHRVKDVIYFAPFDMDYPVAFNVMEDVGYDKRHLVVSGLMSAFKKLWVDAWSARMEYILSNTLLALLEYPGATLLDVNSMYSNKAFRKKVVDNIKDLSVKKFWTEEYAGYTERFAAEATPAIQNKVGQFTSNPLIRNIIGQSKSSFDIRQAMDEKKILIINLSKGRVGETNAALLGSMLVTKIYLAAMSRADVSASTLQALPQFYFYVDEFQNFANQSFADILSEARKYKLNLIIAHQYVEQMEEEVRDAVFGNVGTTVAFRVGPFDAETLETIFAPQFEATDLVNLGFAQIYLTLMIDGVGSPPFSATTLPPFDRSPDDNTAEVLASSREQFGKPRVEVEAAIEEWQSADPQVPEAPKPRYGATGAKPRATTSAAPSAASRPAPRPAPAASPLQPPVPPPAAVLVPVPVITPQPAAQSIVQAVKVEMPAPKVEVHIDARREVPQAPPAAKPQEQPRRQEVPRPSVAHRSPAPRAAVPLKPAAPPLEGATNLRDALAAVTSKPEVPKEPHKHQPEASIKRYDEVSPKPPQARPDHKPAAPKSQGSAPSSVPLSHNVLKEALRKVAPQPQSQAPRSPTEIPPQVLKEMLAVDELDGTRE